MSTSPHVITYKGNRFYPGEGRIDHIDIEDVAHALAYQCRFNGHTQYFYSVAQHSLMVASLVPREQRLAGLLHDAAEAYMGDMVSPLKAVMPDFAAAEGALMRQIGGRFSVNLNDDDGLIRKADLIALATEKRDLLPNACEPWPCLEGIEPHHLPLQPLTASAAKTAFLAAWHSSQHA
ncbi:MAG: phosphohydrolase [Moraxellaceae bacterium]|nr:phosphohydrolase [Moraxellaceae bacterium]